MNTSVQQNLQRASKSISILDAELLLAYVLDKSREFLIANPDFGLRTSEIKSFEGLVEKRKEGVPIAYLTGHKEFYGLDFIVNEHTLIPRPDTELMVDLVIKKANDMEHGTWSMVDVGTGSGCIPISILKTLQPYNLTTLHAFATDISSDALKVAKQNAINHNTATEFLQGNLLEPVFDNVTMRQCNNLIITANLPYLTEEQFQTESSIQHEPKSALVADDHGLAFYKELLDQIKQLVIGYQPAGRQGRLQVTGFFEIDPTQTKKLLQIAKKLFPKSHLEIFKDLQNHDRVVCLSLP